MIDVNGGLGFKATLDIDSFEVSAQAMERRIRDVSNVAVSETSEMDDSLLRFARNGAQYITSYLVGQGMFGLLQSTVAVRGQFQQLEIAFETMLGSADKANALMSQLINTAAKTPFDLQGVASGAKQLMAYGEASDKVNETLVRLGNIASGLSIPLNDIVYLYGTTMVQGRLYAQDVRQFTGRGIPLVKELAKMYGVTADEINRMVSEGKIGFPEVEKVLRGMTDQGGQFYNLMEKQSKSLTGLIANLGDAWDVAQNRLGADNQDLFAAGIQGATYFVEHMDDVLRIVKAITVAYGSYKAAVVLNTLVTKGHTGVAFIDNTARSAKIALLKVDAALTGQSAAQTRAMTAAQEAHTASLQKQLTVEELSNLQKQLRIATIQGLLTAQQQEYLSNLNLTASSAGYEAVAMGVLSVEQREALSKVDLTSKSAVYRAALEQEVAKKTQAQAATISAMKAEVVAASAKVESAKRSAIATMQSAEAARYELYWARKSGDVTRIATAEKRLAGAVDNQAIARKAALAAQTDFYTKKKDLEAATTKGASAATAVDTTVKAANAAGTSVLAAVTTRATLAAKALWLSMKSNPIGWVVGLIGILISATTLLSGKKKEAADATGEFQDSTKKEIDSLNLLFAVLQASEKGTKTHKDAIEKVNAVCKEYNKTLLDENSTIDQQKLKYQELTRAIQSTTAEKIKAKYIEQALQKQADENAKALDELKESAEDAYHKISTGMTTVMECGQMVRREKFERVLSENIRGASGAVWEAVEQDALESVSSLKELTGKAYEDAFEGVLNRLMEKVKRSTMSTSEEIAGFRSSVSDYLSKIAETAKGVQSEMDAVDTQMKAFYSPKDPKPVAESVDYMSMSFSDLEKKAKDASKEIEEINKKTVKVDTDTAKLKELLAMLGEVNSAINRKTASLNTEAGISERIKELKEERANVEINGARYKELTKAIEGLESKLPKKSGKDDGAARNADQLLQKQIEADRKLQEARISVMEEGYKKRKAVLDLRHQQDLQQIDKEEKELEKARRDAGKGMDSSEKGSFAERRRLEEEAYAKEQIKLFDGEIEYKKGQYEAYYRWVENVGKEAADKRFEFLISSGASFVSWIDSQIAELEEKKNRGELSDGEANALNALKIQQNEITGVKSAMDRFTESVSRSVSQAQTLAEKLQAIAAAKDKLERGDFHLNEDDKAAAHYSLNKEQENIQKEINDRLMRDYRTYEEQRKSIQEEYALLRSEAEKEGNQERIKRLNEAESEALSTLNASFLRQTDSWKKLFQDMDTLSVDEIESLVREIASRLQDADLKLSPVDHKTVIDSLNQAKEALIAKNPFKAIGSFYDDYIKAKKKLADARANLASGKGEEKDVKQAESEVKKAAKGVTQSINAVTEIANECGNAIAGMFSDLGEDELAEALGTGVELMGELGNAATSVGKLMAGDVIGGVTGLVSSLTSIAGIFSKLHDKKHEKRIQELQGEIQELERYYHRLERAFNNTYWIFNSQQKDGYEKNIKLIKEQIAALEQEAAMAKKVWALARYAELVKKIAELRRELEKAQAGGDMMSVFESQKEALKAQQEALKKQIEEEKKKKKTDHDKIAEWENKIESINEQIEDLDKSMKETLAGTDVKSAIDEFADALVEAYVKGENAADALGEKTKQVLKKAVVEALKRQFLAKGIADAVNFLGEAMSDHVLTDEEKAKFEALVNAAGALFNEALAGVGDWIKDLAPDSQDPLQGAIGSMSEETGGVIAGRANAIIINQSDMLAIMRAALAYQAEIAANTKVSASELSEIKTILKRIDGGSGNSLLSLGIS